MTISIFRRRSGILFEQIRESNRELDGGIDPAPRAWLNWWQRINRVLALEPEEEKPSPEILRFAEERMQARLARDWKKVMNCATIRAHEWEVRDTKDGQVLTRRARA